ncbi:MAG: FAD-dependent oxidoreductase [Magnetococcus sp. YQC-9]
MGFASNHRITTDYLIIGAGIVGLSIADEIRRRSPEARIVLVEKEMVVGLHASGRNSGVLHSGIYYPEDTLKFRICADGSRRMAEYCHAHRLPIRRVGKLVLATTPDQEALLPVFLERANKLSVRAWPVQGAEIREIEPQARDSAGIYLPDVSVIHGKSVLGRLVEELSGSERVRWLYARSVVAIDDARATLTTDREVIGYGRLINAAGAQVDRIAHACQVGGDYVMLPFRGSYSLLSPQAGIEIRGLIYPVPDSRVPFLGIHFTRSIGDEVHVGPSAFPAFGREHYRGTDGLEILDGARMLQGLARLVIGNPQGFRQHVAREIRQLQPKGFARAATDLVPALRPEHLLPCGKVGIRPQLYNRQENRLEMDFKVLHGAHSVHVLNSISPAFTSAFSFAEWVMRELEGVG